MGEHLLGSIDRSIRRAATAFSGGMGGTGHEACGALSGGALLVGAVSGRANPDQDARACAAQVAVFRERFAVALGATRCNDLLALGFGDKGSTPCSVLVERAAEILLDVMQGRQTVEHRPIGLIRNDFTERTAPDDIRAAVSSIILHPELQDGLLGLEPGMRVTVVYSFHQARQWELLQHRHNDPSEPERGVFSLRSPDRPNPIGVSVAEVVSRSGSELTVRGLDAIDGTPVLDIKKA